MRLRKKKNRDRRFNDCEKWILQPGEVGGWYENAPVYIEIGSGKGGFITELARQNPENRYIAVERELDCLIMAMEKAESMGLCNLRFLLYDAAELTDILPIGKAEGLYINFCDPWHKKRQAKRRLTHRNMFRHYLKLMKRDGILRFKTDNAALFDFSEEEFKELKFDISFLTRDLHKEDVFNVMTEYEKRFSEMGTPIKSAWITPTDATWEMLEEYDKTHPEHAYAEGHITDANQA